MPQPAEVDRLQASILALYEQVDVWLAGQQTALADDVRHWRRRARLAELRDTTLALMDHVDEQSRAWLGDGFPRIYGLGATTAARAVGSAFQWTSPHVDAVTVLANDLFGDLLTATDGVRRSVKQLVRRVAREATTLTVAGGETAVQGGRLMADLLEGRGVWAVRYADGSLHGVGDYSQMAVRTKSAVAYNVGTLKAAPEVGWFEVFDGTGCGWAGHDDDLKANGRIVASSEAFDQPLSHPHCRRAFGPRPEITTASEAAEAIPSPTEAQQQDQTAAERDRADRQAARRRTGAAQRRQERLARQAATAR